MIEFDIILNNIKLRIYCDKKKKEAIEELMNGHAYLVEPNGLPTYNLILIDNFIPKKYNSYIKMIDKWFDNATCDVYIDNNSKTVYMNNISVSNKKWEKPLIQYFACNLFNRLLEEIGYISFHSSCIEKNNQGIAFIAPRNNGKTNCMLNMMHAGFNSVTNDKLAIQFDGKNLNGYGVAQDVSIRLSQSFIKQPQNKKYLDIAKIQNVKLTDDNSLEGNKIHLESTYLAKINNVEQKPTTTIKNILFPIYNGNIKECILEPLNAYELDYLLNSQRLPLVHDTTEFFKEVKTNNYALYNELETLNEIKKLESYKIYQSEYTTYDYINKVKKLIYK